MLLVTPVRFLLRQPKHEPQSGGQENGNDFQCKAL